MNSYTAYQRRNNAYGFCVGCTFVSMFAFNTVNGLRLVYKMFMDQNLAMETRVINSSFLLGTSLFKSTFYALFGPYSPVYVLYQTGFTDNAHIQTYPLNSFQRFAGLYNKYGLIRLIK